MPLVQEGRFWVRLISKDALKQYMKFRGYSVQQLADKIGVSKATVGHLTAANGRTSTSPATAKAIEKALDAPSGSLFLAEVTAVTRTMPQRRTA